MSSTTRVGFTIPARTDFADETIYFDNNVTIYENELPIPMALTPPVSGNYAGRMRAYDVAAVTSPPQPEYPFYSMLYNGSGWVPSGSAGARRNCTRTVPGNGSSLSPTTSSEVFQSNPMPGFSSISVTAGQVLKFCCSYNVKWFSTTTQSLKLNGAFNIFINPNSSSQPIPTTPGAVRLSDPIVFSDDFFAGNNSGGTANGYFETFYSEFFYLVTATGTIGVSAYLSATFDSMSGGDFIGIYDPAGLGLDIGIGSNQFVIEACGTWSA